MQESLLDSNLKIERAVEGLRNQFVRRLSDHGHKQNALTIAKFLLASTVESNISNSYKEDLIFTLCKLSIYVGKNFKDFDREDVLSFLDSYRKTEPKDPLHGWIGSYNLHRGFIVKFFRWMYYADVKPMDRPKPDCVANIPNLKRKEKSIYKPTDLWTAEDDLLFLKYCPSKRDRCYHAISRDSSCRPHEIIKLRIKDVVFKMAGEKQYAEILVNGKTGQRHIPLINSIPYLKDWLDDQIDNRPNDGEELTEEEKRIQQLINTPVTEEDIKLVFETLYKEAKYDKISIKQLFYGMCSAFTKTGIPHNVNSKDSGAGKNYLLELCSRVFPDKYVEQFVGVSDKAFVHRRGQPVIEDKATGQLTFIQPIIKELENEINNITDQIAIEKCTLPKNRDYEKIGKLTVQQNKKLREIKECGKSLRNTSALAT